MQQESKWRLYLTAAVTVLCLLLFYPTMRYVQFVYTNPVPTDAVELKMYDDQKAALQRKAIPLGLDLVGGVDVLLQIDEDKTKANGLDTQRVELVRDLQGRQINASVELPKSGEVLDVSIDDKENARQVANILDERVKNKILVYDQPSLLATGKTRVELNPDYLRKQIVDSLEAATRKIRERVDQFGVTQPSVSKQGEKQLRVQIPGERDTKRVVNDIIQPAQLEFYALYRGTATGDKGVAHDSMVMRLFEPTEELGSRGTKRVTWKLKEGEKLPQGYVMMPGRPLTRLEEDALLEQVKSKTASPLEHVYIVEQRPRMDARDLRDAFVQTNQTNFADPIYVGLTFGPAGAREFAQLSKNYLQDRMAIALDRHIYSAPVFQSVIPNGQAQITGHFSQEAAHDLAMVLKAGALPASLEVKDNREIGPTLGAESITRSTQALVLAGLCITVFMVVYYGTAGFISIIALILNLLVIVACLNLFGATLTLSGIGGIILTIGMAVDGNVLIYERIREEIAAGRSLRDALRHGFHAVFIVILDSHLTVLLAAFVLLQFGTGSVQGFALTMAFGLIANLFTNLTVTYALCLKWFEWTGKLGVGSMRMLHNVNLDFIGFRNKSFTISAVLGVAAIVFLLFRGPEMAVDFKGGVLTEVRVTADSGEDQTAALGKILDPTDTGEARVARVTGQNVYVVRYGLLADPAAEGSKRNLKDPQYTKEKIEKDLKSDPTLGDKIEILSTTSVSTEVGQSFQQIALVVIVATSLAIMAFLWFRFELVFGVAAVVALIHDLILTLALLTLMKFQVSLDVVSALLILLGFSTNDTIVIFDRIRENSHTMFGASFKNICNNAMNKMLGRTLITSGTVIGVMVIMYLFGGRSLAPFAMTMIIGGLVGTYSSDFIAAPMVYWWNERQKGKLVEHLGRSGAGPQVNDTRAVAGEAGVEGAAATAAAQDQMGTRRGRR